MKLSISQAKRLREQIEAVVVVVLSIDPDGTQHVATHGKTRPDARAAAKLGNDLKKGLAWPLPLCQAIPLQRICKNCAYFEVDRGVFCANGWSGDGSRGRCLAVPSDRPFTIADQTCSMFEPQ